jgi:hypothetical protein
MILRGKCKYSEKRHFGATRPTTNEPHMNPRLGSKNGTFEVTGWPWNGSERCSTKIV